MIFQLKILGLQKHGRAHLQQASKRQLIRKTLVEIAASSHLSYQRIFVGRSWSDDVEEIYRSVNSFCYGNEELLEGWSVDKAGSASTLFIYFNQLIKYSKMGWHFHLTKDDLEKIRRLHGEENANIIITIKYIKSNSIKYYHNFAIYSLFSELLCSVQVFYHKAIFVVCSTAEVASFVHNCLQHKQG